jgi:replicative DNA helicase
MAGNGKRSAPPPEPIDELVPPHNIEAEKAVLGAVLLHNDALVTIDGLLEPPDFYRKAHQQIFAAMLAIQEDRVDAQIDPVTLKARLNQLKQLEAVGGPAYVMSLVDGLPHATNIEYYAQLVKEASRLRQVIVTAGKLVQRAHEADSRAVDLAGDAADQLYELGSHALPGQPVFLNDLLTPGIEALEFATTHKDTVAGMSTGFRDLDDMTAGLHSGELILIAARTSVGKTALAMNIARNVGDAHTVLVFSLEMEKLQLFLRMFAAEARVDSQRMRTGRLLSGDWDRLSKAMVSLAPVKVLIDDTPSIGLREVRARSRQVRAEHGLGLVVVDYLQLMRGRGRFDNRTQEIGSISRGLKAVAKEFQIPVIALAQLSRAAEGQFGRKARKPQLSDLRESGDLENDADVVFLIYRQEPKQDESGILTVSSLEAEVIVAKQRNGPTGSVSLSFVKEYVRFDNATA